MKILVYFNQVENVSQMINIFIIHIFRLRGILEVTLPISSILYTRKLGAGWNEAACSWSCISLMLQEGFCPTKPDKSGDRRRV